MENSPWFLVYYRFVIRLYRSFLDAISDQHLFSNEHQRLGSVALFVDNVFFAATWLELFDHRRVLQRVCWIFFYIKLAQPYQDQSYLKIEFRITYEKISAMILFTVMQRRVSELILRVEPRLWASVDEEFDEPKVLKPRGCVQGRYTISGILFLERRSARIGSERVAEFSFFGSHLHLRCTRAEQLCSNIEIRRCSSTC